MEVRFSAKNPAEIEADLLVVAVTEDLEASLGALDALFGKTLIAHCQDRKFSGKADSHLQVPVLGKLKAKELLLIGVGKGTPAQIVKAAGKAGREARAQGHSRLSIDLGPLAAERVGGVLEAVAAGNYAYQKFKPEADRSPQLTALNVFRAESKAQAQTEAARALSRAAWQAVVRDQVNAPPAELYPASMVESARTLAKLPGVSVEVWDFDRLKKEGWVGIAAVGQGSDKPPFMVHLSYKPKKAAAHVALVGKGVTFDSGGLSLKPGPSMQTMRCDMAGAATAMGAFAAAVEQQLPIRIDCVIGLAENMVSGNSYKLGDVLIYKNGVTVEIHNTDAEGRLVLADCLIYASSIPGVTHLVDLATLTGAAVVALGPELSALYTEDNELAEELLAAARRDSEGLWRMPLHAPYKGMLKADWAQLRNIGGRDAGSITAALFLQHFVGPNIKWAHLDIAGPAFFEKQTDHYAIGASGIPTRTLVSWLERVAKT